MVYSSSSSESSSTLLLFGPQALSLNGDILTSVQSVLNKDRSCTWIAEAISELPMWLDEFSKTATDFSIHHGRQTLQDLVSWATTGSSIPDPHCLPNIALSPLVVAIQLVQYKQYLEATRSDPVQELVIDSRQEHVTGLCTGLLSAFAVTSSSSYDDLAKYGAVALRLAMLIGLVVDAHELASGSRSRSFAVSWPTAEVEAAVTHRVHQQPQVSILVSLLIDKY